VVYEVNNERGHRGKNRMAVSPQPILHIDILNLRKSIQIAPNFPHMEIEITNMIMNIKISLQFGLKNSLIVSLFIIIKLNYGFK